MKSFIFIIILLSISVIVSADRKMSEAEARKDALEDLCQKDGSLLHCLMLAGYSCKSIENEKNEYMCTNSFYGGGLSKLKITRLPNEIKWTVEHAK